MRNGAAFVPVSIGSFFSRLLQGSQGFSVLRWCFFPRRANKKGLRWCLFWLYQPAWQAERSHFICASSSRLLFETAREIVCKCLYCLASWACRRCPTGRVCTKELPGWQSTLGDRKGPRTARRSASFKCWYVSALYVLFSYLSSDRLNE